MTTLGRLEKMALRGAWANEAGEFTLWKTQVYTDKHGLTQTSTGLHRLTRMI